MDLIEEAEEQLNAEENPFLKIIIVKNKNICNAR